MADRLTGHFKGLFSGLCSLQSHFLTAQLSFPLQNVGPQAPRSQWSRWWTRWRSTSCLVCIRLPSVRKQPTMRGKTWPYRRGYGEKPCPERRQINKWLYVFELVFQGAALGDHSDAVCSYRGRNPRSLRQGGQRNNRWVWMVTPPECLL